MGYDFDSALLQQDHPVPQVDVALSTVTGMDSIAPVEVGDQVTLVDLTEPEHVTQANVVEPVTFDGFVVRGLHTCDETPVPDEVKRALVTVVGVCAKP